MLEIADDIVDVQENAKLDDEQKWCVYVHINIINGKKYYGITSRDPEDRWKNGNGYQKQTYFKNAINKYGWDNFEHKILHYNLLYAQAVELEKYYIAKDKTNVCKWKDQSCGYNMTDGGEGVSGRTHSVEAKQKIRQHSLEMWKDPDMRSLLILKHSGENNVNYGKHFSEEVKEKISISRKGKCVGEDNPFYGKHHTENTIEYLRMVANKKPVMSEVGVFESVRAAARYINGSSSHISECCNHKRKTEGINPETEERLYWSYMYDCKQKDGSIIKGAVTLGYITEEEVNEYLNNIKQKGNEINGETI